MNRAALQAYIVEVYKAQAEVLWEKHPNYLVFRHKNNQKWFAAILDVPKEKLGLSQPGMLDILNVKRDPMMAGSFRKEPGIYPGYHMNKANWLSVALDGSVDEEKIKLLLDISFDLTAKKVKRPRAQSQA